jgi:hypothetical protein
LWLLDSFGMIAVLDFFTGAFKLIFPEVGAFAAFFSAMSFLLSSGAEWGLLPIEAMRAIVVPWAVTVRSLSASMRSDVEAKTMNAPWSKNILFEVDF